MPDRLYCRSRRLRPFFASADVATATPQFEQLATGMASRRSPTCAEASATNHQVIVVSWTKPYGLSRRA
ncbi:hypothetical protein, partial [Streptomyces sp. NPDC058731]|uniref:hypothetical protein n=1 Tax=Streptomyces sp. NPDC058731 TaxID=3346613 RepID=UPI0036B7E627